ncbi:glycosyltransferase family 2 protein [Halobacterium salinarum]|uniref:glycosyltransferase family 2 protein n=1 Tax=Halobacterium salinarum TaxID=2242 RepID=UPI002552C2D8|nr:glycosyltransferase family 2 protein [Halobacterium salinarum]MDL0121116.1 glycosyltransferase family 2 protein [Halobacterium salinarum]MDL0135797.1 glycosyltransferase family 2 protein [Halobacterium salinarum]MDL0138287.1 glycosyltransferase family 2 protein [Halobacterium salinarum]
MTNMHSRGFSVVIPVLNEAGTIEGCLDSLLRATIADVNFEFLVVDGMSDDGTRDIVKGYSRKHSSIRLVHNEKQTTPTGFNKGFEVATNDIIVLMSGHARVTPDFFDHIRELFKERAPDADIVGSRVKPVADGYVQTSIAGALMSRFGAGSKRFQGYEGYVDTVSYGAYKREVIETVGKVNPELPRGQDYEYNKRARECGFTLYQSAESTTQYEPRSSFLSLFKQKFGNGQGKARIHQQDNSGPDCGLRFLTAGLGLSMLSLFIPGIFLALTVLPLIYILGIGATAVETVQSNEELSKLHAPGIMLTLSLIHIGYASGFVSGLLGAH